MSVQQKYENTQLTFHLANKFYKCVELILKMRIFRTKIKNEEISILQYSANWCAHAART